MSAKQKTVHGLGPGQRGPKADCVPLTMVCAKYISFIYFLSVNWKVAVKQTTQKYILEAADCSILAT